MQFARRRFLAGAGLAFAAGAARAAVQTPASPPTPSVTPPAIPPGTPTPTPPASPPPVPSAVAPSGTYPPATAYAPPATPPRPGPRTDWRAARAQFALSPQYIDMSAMLITSHPKPVRDAIERHRAALDANPVVYLEGNNRSLQNRVREAAGAYFDCPMSNVALTDSTTEGVALIYNGLKLRAGQEILTTDQDYYVTHESLRLAALKSGARVRKISLFEDIDQVSAGQLAGRIMGAITPATRVVALTWVHSSTGLKLPIRMISAGIRGVNASRPEWNKVLLCVDGVHGFGNQDVGFADLGCDFFAAGCHKWMFGPRGTGVVFGSPQGWAAINPTIPTFLDSAAYTNWISGADPGPTTGARLTPGGFKAFEHVWAAAEAFNLHRNWGRAQVAERTTDLATQLKQGLAAMSHVRLVTPMNPQLSAGIVSFDVNGMSAEGVVARLRDARVIGSVAPYARPHVRLTPSVRNFPNEIEIALNAVKRLA